MRPRAVLARRLVQCARTASDIGKRTRTRTRMTTTATRSQHARTVSSSSMRASSSSATPDAASAATPDADEPTDDPPAESTEKQRKTSGRKASAATKAEKEVVELPPDLDILWDISADSGHASSDLPPPELMQEALNNLLITLHPKTQNRAAYLTSRGPPLEPTLALYCPIEGGDYIIDETVKELARKTNSEVVVLDAIQLAAGEHSIFGAAGEAIKLPNNPLQAPSPSDRSPFMPALRAIARDDEDDNEFPFTSASPGGLVLTLLPGSVGSSRGSAMSSTTRGSAAPSPRIKAFFDEVVNVSNKDPFMSSDPSPRRPRIIYIKDFPTLAPTASTWYPPLLSSVRARRLGPISRPGSPVLNPMTIVFGITPPINPTSSSPSSTGPPHQSAVMSMSQRIHRSRPFSPSSSKHPARSEWAEDGASGRARERRLKERMKNWEQGDFDLRRQLPPFSAPSMSDGTSGRSSRSSSGDDIVMVGSPNIIRMPPSMLGRVAEGGGVDSSYFRTSIIVPSERDASRERATRVTRRREINTLSMRMGISNVGGLLGPAEHVDLPEVEDAESSGSERDTMWREWGDRIEEWITVKEVADRAVGDTVATSLRAGTTSQRPSLDPTSISWDTVESAWMAHRTSRDIRRSWIAESSVKMHEDPSEEMLEDGSKDADHDEIIEAVKDDPDLEQHEDRLLGCIINPSTMPTSFKDVHLPTHTIDSVRTIVSLPLLHPAAFSTGILRQHTMTGCLLFGPPGTGKTLVVRALAKEAGCRMMVIKPSDVMDMYVGEAEKLVRAVFSLARRLSPCVVFIDELDSLFGSRTSARETGGTVAHRGVITEFMQEMDGLKTTKDSSVIVIGATNRPFDLDDAVLRRLPRRLLIDLPGEAEREAILRILMRDETISSDLDIAGLAKRTDGFSGSDLKHLCVAAVLDAVKENVELPWEVVRSSVPVLVSGTDVSDADPITRSHSDASKVATSEGSDPESKEDEPEPTRVLQPRHFIKALKEITPSASESLGTLADLRKWNEEFGEGGRKRERRMWGRGRFGFTDKMDSDSFGRVDTDASSR